MAILRDILEWIRDSWGFADGLDTTDYVDRLERHFAIRFDAVELEATKTLGNLVDLISGKLTTASRAEPDAALWSVVPRITSEEFGIDARELHRRIRFVEDLCC